MQKVENRQPALNESVLESCGRQLGSGHLPIVIEEGIRRLLTDLHRCTDGPITRIF